MLAPRRRWFEACGVIVTALAAVGAPERACAHEGPPFPILMDKPLAEYVVSVWADPDIGEAKFFVVVESAEGGPPRQAPEVSMWVEPVNQRRPRNSYPAKLRVLRNQMQFEAKPHFDQRDMWKVGFQLTAPGGTTHELTTEVESTPPGYGPWDLAIYLFPFVLLGGMWMAAMIRRRTSHMPRQPGEPDDARLSRNTAAQQWCEA
jgi:hypothetical protein